MAEDNRKQGERMYQSLCSMLDGMKWKYKKIPEKLMIECSAVGDDLPIPLKIWVEPDRHTVRFYSHLVYVDKSRLTQVSLALSAANYALVIGCFDFDLSDGEISFRLTMPYRDSILSETLLGDLLYTTCSTVDRYNDKLDDLIKDKITLNDFIDFVRNKK